MTLLALFNSYMHRMLEKGIRLSQEASWLGLCGMDFFSVMPGERLFHAAFAVVLTEMGAFLGNVLTSLLVQIRENPEFHDLMQRDKKTWLRCLLWHGWLPALDGAGFWAVGPNEVAAHMLESRLGGYAPHVLSGWVAFQECVAGFGSGAGGAFLLHCLLVLDGSIVLGGTWICFHLIMLLELKGPDFIVLFQKRL